MKPRWYRTGLILACSLMAPAVWAAQQKKVTGKVVKVVDGDTFDLLDGKTTYRVRMYGIDAPEKKQDFGNRSKDALGEACKQQPITIVIRNKDRYQRFVADAYDAKGQRINVVMVKQGYAWYYEKFSPKDKELADAQQYAQKHRLGLWQQSKPIAPWDWRQLKKEEREQLKVAS